MSEAELPGKIVVGELVYKGYARDDRRDQEDEAKSFRGEEMKRTEILIGGVGGQGVILAGILLGTAATLFDHKKAVQTQAYSSEQRGGMAKSEVILASDPITDPQVRRPDILIALAEDAIKRHLQKIKPGGLVVDGFGSRGESETGGLPDVGDSRHQHGGNGDGQYGCGQPDSSGRIDQEDPAPFGCGHGEGHCDERSAQGQGIEPKSIPPRVGT